MREMRESLMVQRDETLLAGEVQIDGAYVGGSLRPENRAEDRVDRRLVEHQNPDRRCVIALRASLLADDPQGRVGAERTLTAIVKRTDGTTRAATPGHCVRARSARRVVGGGLVHGPSCRRQPSVEDRQAESTRIDATVGARGLTPLAQPPDAEKTACPVVWEG
jgi:hypothetical protein